MMNHAPGAAYQSYPPQNAWSAPSFTPYQQMAPAPLPLPLPAATTPLRAPSFFARLVLMQRPAPHIALIGTVLLGCSTLLMYIVTAAHFVGNGDLDFAYYCNYTSDCSPEATMTAVAAMANTVVTIALFIHFYRATRSLPPFKAAAGVGFAFSLIAIQMLIPAFIATNLEAYLDWTAAGATLYEVAHLIYLFALIFIFGISNIQFSRAAAPSSNNIPLVNIQQQASQYQQQYPLPQQHDYGYVQQQHDAMAYHQHQQTLYPHYNV